MVSMGRACRRALFDVVVAVCGGGAGSSSGWALTRVTSGSPCRTLKGSTGDAPKVSGWVPVNDRLIRRERGREREREERESVTQSGWALSDACNVRQPVSDKASTGDAPMVFVYPLMIDSSLREREGGGREGEGERGRERE